ncbi:hypothetical protein GCM10023187_11130 [Nibrella viscosa]|uniref:Uncharacterized protein n=1 Tax=Nibrella viscosa TaxID=1084524 RepID=A0ABP8K1Q2_9BACT
MPDICNNTAHTEKFGFDNLSGTNALTAMFLQYKINNFLHRSPQERQPEAIKLIYSTDEGKGKV